VAKSSNNENNHNVYEERFAILERRLAAAERKLNLIESSRVGGELRMMQHADAQRALDHDHERDMEQKRKAAAADRAKAFKRFARERLAVHDDLAVTQRELIVQYNRWALDNGVPKLHRCESDTELVEAMQVVYPKYESVDVPQPGYLGRHTPMVPGYDGIGLVAEGEDPAEVVKRLKAEDAREEAERRGRREDHQLAASVEDAVVRTKVTRDKAAALAVEAAEK
jgi:hypothetical protein